MGSFTCIKTGDRRPRQAVSSIRIRSSATNSGRYRTVYICCTRLTPPTPLYLCARGHSCKVRSDTAVLLQATAHSATNRTHSSQHPVDDENKTAGVIKPRGLLRKQSRSQRAAAIISCMLAHASDGGGGGSPPRCLDDNTAVTPLSSSIEDTSQTQSNHYDILCTSRIYVDRLGCPAPRLFDRGVFAA